MPMNVLMPVAGGDPDGPTFAAALTVARMFGAHLVALHVRPDVQRDVASLAAADMGVGAGLSDVMARMEEAADRRQQAAETAWRGFCTANGITVTDQPGAGGTSSEWRNETGDEADWLARYGRMADLIVLGRGGDGAITAGGLIEAALMSTGKPVLLASSGGSGRLDGTVAIAWKDTKEAAGAVSAALPFITRATRVVVYSVLETDDGTSDVTARQLAASLRWHGVTVEVRDVHPAGKPAVDAMLEAVASAGCDLLVMGGYGHSRLREAMFGGFTRAVLDRAPLPVLIAH